MFFTCAGSRRVERTVQCEEHTRIYTEYIRYVVQVRPLFGSKVPWELEEDINICYNTKAVPSTVPKAERVSRVGGSHLYRQRCRLSV